MYENSGDSSTWNQILSSPGYIGSDGVGQASEDSCHTPQGIYGFTMAFGNLPDPGSAIPYTQTDANSYWVDDPDSLFYNRFVYVTDASTPSAETTVTPDVLVNDPNYLSGRILLSPSIRWNSAENLHDAGYAYNYALALDVNSNCTPGAGSAFFLHCNINKPTQGCITVPEAVMRDILINIKPDCHIIIDTAERLNQY